MDRNLLDILPKDHVELVQGEENDDGDDRGDNGCPVHLTCEDQFTEYYDSLKGVKEGESTLN